MWNSRDLHLIEYVFVHAVLRSEPLMQPIKTTPGRLAWMQNGEGQINKSRHYITCYWCCVYALLCTGPSSAFLYGWNGLALCTRACMVMAVFIVFVCLFCFLIKDLIGGIYFIHSTELLWKLHYKSYSSLKVKVMGGVRCT